MQNNFYLTLFLLHVSISILFSQITIDFAQHEEQQSVDYHSFYPALMLKHTIGTFYKLPKNPVLSPAHGGWDMQDVADPFVLVTADSILLFYDGSAKGHYSLGYVVRDDAGWGWVGRKQILKGDKQNWRSFHLIAPTIVPGKNQLLIFNGNNSDSELGYKAGLAQKDKSGQWQYKSVKPLFKPGPKDWDFAGNAYQDVVYFPKEKKYKMWYSGFFGPFASIGLAESDDGIVWRKIKNKPIFESSPGVIAPDIIFNGETYTMYFAQLNLNRGFRTVIKSAESQDGISWGNIKTILKPKAKWEGKRLMRPNISFFEEQVHLFYCAQKGSKWQIGEAIADAQFEAAGMWQSEKIKNTYSRLRIKFEQPFQTVLKIKLLDEANGAGQIIDLELEKSELRSGVFSSSASIDPNLASFIIQVDLISENETRSPVVYEIILE